jgi:hypothetical protein
MEQEQDVFISHAGADKPTYIEPLADALTQKGVTFWLDNIEIAWGDSVTMKINEGLRSSRFVLLCLSSHYLRRQWPETELSAAFSVQNDTGIKRVLPLILNSKPEILARYPLIAGLAYRDFSVGPHTIANELATLAVRPKDTTGQIRITVESVHSGHLCSIIASPRVSIRWLADKARAGMGVSETAETGAHIPFRVRWVLVDTRAESVWIKLPRSKQRKIRGVSSRDGVPIFAYFDSDRLDDLKIQDGVVFHMYAIEDEDYDIPVCSPAR